MNISPVRLWWLYLRGAFFWMGLGFALVGVALIALGIWIWQWEQGFQSRSVQAVAKITRKEKGSVQTGKNRSEIAYFLVYTFADDAGRQQGGKIGAPFEDWKRAKPGDTVAIEYDRANPATSRRAGTEAHAGWGLLILGGIGGVFAYAGFSLAAIAFVVSGRRARLVRFGTPALGTAGKVVENDSALGLKGTYRLTYSFTDGDGQSRDGRGPPQKWSLAARWDPGETILVLYNDRNPNRNEADIWEARGEDLERLLDQDNSDQGNTP